MATDPVEVGHSYDASPILSVLVFDSPNQMGWRVEDEPKVYRPPCSATG
jgi:hypothetical protein